MTADRWAKLESLFDQALSLSESGRGRWLESLRGRDPELAGEMSRLLRNLERAGSFFDQAAPAFRTHALEPGEVVADRFEVLELAGVGGMGEVYAARDRELGEQVALKLLPPGLADRLPDQFRQEVQTARRVAHPNVCRVFDLGKYARDGAACSFLTMEWIAGPTLAARLAEGPLEPVEADRVLREALAGLEAAHQAGVLHRDLKPSNIMLRDAPLPSGHRVVLTDFGLARPAAAGAATPASTGVITGTPLYMAPEQIEGAAASIRSDLYAFGLCAYEVFTGQQPFGAGGPLAAIVKRARAKPAAPATLAPRTPAGWNRAILACLEPDPARRPARVSELLAIVLRDRVPFSARLPRRQVMLGTLTAAASAAGFAVWQLWPAGSPESPGGVRLLVGPAVNQTGEPQFDAWGLALHTQLTQSSHVQTVRPEESPETLQLMRKSAGEPLSAGDLRHLALRLEVPLVLHATLSRVGENYALQLLLEQVAAGSSRAARAWPKTVLAESPRALHSALHEATLWLRRLTGESAEAIQLNAKRPEEVTTDSWEALRNFEQAERLHREGRTSDAVILLRQAVERDPEFAMAHARLGDFSLTLRDLHAGLTAWQRAVTLARRGRLSQREELRIRGLYAADTEDYAAAERDFRTLALLYPHDSRARHYVGYALRGLGRDAEAVEAFLEAERQHPSWTNHSNLAGAYLAMGRLEDALRAARALRAAGRTSQAAANEGAVRFLRADLAGAARDFALLRASADHTWASVGGHLEACLLCETGKLGEAEAVLDESRRSDEERRDRSAAARKWIALAQVRLRRGDRTSARTAAGEALRAEPSAATAVQAVRVLCAAGATEDARRLKGSFDFPHEGQRARSGALWIEGELHAAEGRTARCVASFEAAARLTPPRFSRRRFWQALTAAGRLEDAFRLAEAAVSVPGRIWEAPHRNEPGAFSDSLLDHAQLAARLGRQDAAQSSLQRYRALRQADGVAHTRSLPTTLA